MDKLASRLKYARKMREMTQEELAHASGVKQSVISKIETGSNTSPMSIFDLAKALNVRSEWLFAGPPAKMLESDNIPPASYVVNLGITEPSNAEPARLPSTLIRIPVVGTARMGDDGYYEELGHPVGHGDGCVDSFSTDKNAYALRVKGDSMHPAIRHGSFVVVEPNGECMPGEYIVLVLTDGRKMVKELIAERHLEVIIESVNGNHRQTIDKEDIEKMHPVAAVVAPSKWRSG